MPSSPLGSTHGRTTSGVACQHGPWIAATVERCLAWHAIIALERQTRLNAVVLGRRQAWHAIIALGRETRSNNVERGMPSPPWDSTNGQTTSGVACYHRLWAAQTVGRSLAWHAITALGQHTRSDDVWRVTTSPSSDSTHGRTLWVVA
uniref:Uncharacterized protein n=1 Tax=Solanum lycopersicum TaxID=4081 RepID=A0A494G9L3_SOLLC